MDEESNESLTLRTLRQSAGYSQAKLGKQLGVSQSAVKLWESGECEPSISNVVALAKTLNVSLKTICTSIGVDLTGIPEESNEGGSLACPSEPVERTFNVSFKTIYKSIHIEISGIAAEGELLAETLVINS